jgi:hypothetical protein
MNILRMTGVAFGAACALTISGAFAAPAAAEIAPSLERDRPGPVRIAVDRGVEAADPAAALLLRPGEEHLAHATDSYTASGPLLGGNIQIHS